MTSHERVREPIEILIKTKLQIPPVKSRLIRRDRLIDRLEAGKNRKVFLVMGLAGSGKTSLVRQWIAQLETPVAWYSLDKTDNEQDTFLRYLAEAMSSLHDTLASALEPCREGQQGLSAGQVLPLLIRTLSSLEDDYYLVLDDYHMVTSPEVHDCVSYLFHHMPHNMHVVIATRHAIPFPLSRYRVRNDLVEISSVDLTFTETETKEFFEETFGIELTTGQAQSLTDRMEGWVGGLQLMGLVSGRHGGWDPIKIPGISPPEITDYLVEEVLNTIPEKMRDFILATTPLERFNTELCREITGFADAGIMLDHVCRNNLFLVSLDEKRMWYRYHHLFSETIRERLKVVDRERFNAVHRRAALWFVREGYLEDALRHGFSSGDMQFFGDILEDCLPALHNRYELATFQKWLRKLPREIYLERGFLMILECLLKVESLRVADAKAILDTIEQRRDVLLERYTGTKRKLCDDYLRSLRSGIPLFIDPALVEVDAINEALRQIAPECEALGSLVKTLIPSSYLMQGKILSAKKALEEASVLVFSSPNLFAQLIWFRLAAFLELTQGRLHKSEAIIDEALLLLQRKGLSDTELTFLIALPRVCGLVMRNDLEHALEHSITTLSYVERSGFLFEVAQQNALLSLVYAASGHTDDACRHMEKAQWAAKELGTPSVMLSVDIYKARLSMALGDLKWAREWADKRFMRKTDSSLLDNVRADLVYGELLCREEDYRTAISHLENIHDLCIKENMLEAILFVKILLSSAFYAMDNIKKAETTMTDALNFAGAEGYIRPFVDLASLITPILTHIALSGGYRGPLPHLMEVLKACHISISDIERTAGSAPNDPLHLTSREIEILRLLAMGYTYRRIGEQTFVSYETVKTHLKHIYEKLHVRSKLEAIRWAERSGLFRHDPKAHHR